MVLVPFGPLRWYRLVRYDGTDCSATVVPIRPLRWYRLTDTISKPQWSADYALRNGLPLHQLDGRYERFRPDRLCSDSLFSSNPAGDASGPDPVLCERGRLEWRCSGLLFLLSFSYYGIIVCVVDTLNSLDFNCSTVALWRLGRAALLAYVDGSAVRVCNCVGVIKGVQVNFAHTYVEYG